MMKNLLFLFCVSSFCTTLWAQTNNNLSETPTDTTYQSASQDFNFSKRKKVFWTAGISGYTAMASGLYFAWYDKYDQESFHFFNDWDEWQNMDKAGHVYSAYLQSSLIYDLGKWSGYSDEKALLISSVASLWGQMNIEIMDGFSSEWGFSIPDVASNLVGTGLFYVQQKIWKEQRLRMKMSYWPVSYGQEPIYSENGISSISLRQRSEDLYGSGKIERFLKDYNGQTIWLSVDVGSFFPESRIPKILGLALGYSGQNLFGGFRNAWEVNDQSFLVDADLYPRSSQFILALDYNLQSVYHSTEFGKALFKVLNIFKFPAPAVSYDTKEGFKFHLVFLN